MSRWPKKVFIVQPGDTFGVFVVEQAEPNDCWRCRCKICGTTITPMTNVLRYGTFTYCVNEQCKRPDLIKRFRKEYQIWHRLRAMCEDPNSPEFHRAGALGKHFSSRWQEFAAFLMDLGPQPTDDHGVYRIDPNGDFVPSNCHWALKTEQVRDGARLLTYKGETLPLSAWARRVGINKATLDHRITEGWTVEDALERPVRDAPEPQLLTLHGKTQTHTQWAAELELSASTIRQRKLAGKTDAEALLPVEEPDTRRVVEFRGEALTLAEWADRIGIRVSNLKIRLERLPLEEALTLPRGQPVLLHFGGASGTASEHARRLGVSPSLVADRLQRGWSLERALTLPLVVKQPKQARPPRPPRPDHAGERFHALLAVSRVEREHYWNLWLWRCDCGAEIEVTYHLVRNGTVRSCVGCRGRYGKQDLVGLKVGRLTVTAHRELDYWVCRCSCGDERIARSGSLLRGTATGCRDCQQIKQGGSFEDRLYAVAAAMRSHKAELYAAVDASLCMRPHQFEFVIIPYIFDLALFDTNTLVEFDGPHHKNTGQRTRDARKDLHALEKGYRVIRVPTEQGVTVLDPALVAGL